MAKSALKTTDTKSKKSALTVQDVQQSLKSAWRKIEPHIGFFYAVFLLLGLTFTVFIVSQTLNSAPTNLQSNSDAEIDDYSLVFDQSTITKVQELDDNASSNASVSLPAGRINPFAE
jgi:hypothetical protein